VIWNAQKRGRDIVCLSRLESWAQGLRECLKHDSSIAAISKAWRWRNNFAKICLK
jgi:hypothetical protein